MPIVVGISLRTSGKIYYFDPGSEHYIHGERVLVETARGPELGTVKIPPCEVPEEQIVPPLKPVVRRASAADITRNSLNREREENALVVCRRLVEKLKLPMRLIDAQFTLDGSHVLIYFLSENRVDFRELVRELAHELRARIELRQVGVRDEAKLLGGYGICGRKLCCSSFLDNFAPVAISMAKDQGLALNPQKISGNCGRLMCCLAFECDQYRAERAELPRLNATVDTPRGVGKVTKLNVLARQVEITIPELPAPIWFDLDELSGNKQPAHACCGTENAEHGCGKCCGTHESAPFPEIEMAEEIVEPVPVELASVTVNAAPAAAPSPATASAAQEQPSVRSPRHRRRRPAAKPQEAKPAPPAAAAPAKTETAAEKSKRPRRRKPRTANAEGKPAPAPVSVKAGGSAESGVPNKPPISGRYRPRRRRPSDKGGNKPPTT